MKVPILAVVKNAECGRYSAPTFIELSESGGGEVGKRGLLGRCVELRNMSGRMGGTWKRGRRKRRGKSGRKGN